ncbi:hypothetical protein HK097_008612 [Rhizophlyctis rosea]|uniref:WW domain-containing protein n=1 Tax=Rhizophlyctis rosea TaxID=64517 RepID=A0AAD5SA85_9FUNG|nr:hypothetical protein HK097_008612 [Rhizophlyctis rosea]
MSEKTNAPASPSPIEAADNDTTGTPAPAPGNWQSVWDEVSQAWYWWDPTTNEVTWDDPSDPAFAEKQKQAASKSGADNDGSQSKVDSSPASPFEKSTTIKSATSASATTIDPTTDYYNSAEYYDWYYSQYAQQQTDTTPQQPVSELDRLLDTIDTTVKQTLDKTAPPRTKRAAEESLSHDREPSQNKSNLDDLPPAPAQPTKTPVDYSDYTMTASFDRRTGRFRPLSDPRFADPRSHFDQASKAARQCNFFFDYEGYQQERAAKRMALEAEGGDGGKKEKKLTKKELEFYKNRKKEKKASALRARYAD